MRRWSAGCERLRDEVAARLAAVEDAEQRAEAFNERIAAARDEIAAVRANAEAEAAALADARARREAALASLQSQVDDWTSEVQRLERISARQAQQQVGDWFGDWAIPESIVMCESGGNWGAVNPSSGAGGAYQILPSTWDLYGGEGDPEDASPGEQSEIASADLGRLRRRRLGLRRLSRAAFARSRLDEGRSHRRLISVSRTATSLQSFAISRVGRGFSMCHGRLARGLTVAAVCAAASLGAASTASAGTLPPGFQETTAFSGLTNPTVVRFAPDGTVFVAEKSGLIKTFDGLDDPTATLYADLRTQVHNFWDRGLLGMSLDFFYEDYHRLRHLHPRRRDRRHRAALGHGRQTSDGCPTPPGPTGDGCVVSGRVSRLVPQAGGAWRGRWS